MELGGQGDGLGDCVLVGWLFGGQCTRPAAAQYLQFGTNAKACFRSVEVSRRMS
jgi:hypothetical protein